MQSIQSNDNSVCVTVRAVESLKQHNKTSIIIVFNDFTEETKQKKKRRQDTWQKQKVEG